MLALLLAVPCQSKDVGEAAVKMLIPREIPMSVTSAYNTDRSGVLAKRYAILAADFFDHPEQALSSTARVPLENLFRILEMYRHGAFSDDHRLGILTMVSQSSNYSVEPREEAWHSEIEAAINVAMTEAFAEASREDAVQSLQRSLRSLARPSLPQAEGRESAKLFFRKFSEALT